MNNLSDELNICKLPEEIDIELIKNNINLMTLNNNNNILLIDNIYYIITKNKNKYSILYQIINNLGIKNINEIKKRIREIKLIIKPIYQIIHESEDDSDLENNFDQDDDDFSTLLNLIQVILIIKTKIDIILKERNIILLTYDLNTYKKNIEDLLETDPKIIKELLIIFNYSEDQIDNELIDSEIIKNILNTLENYYNIESIIKKNVFSDETDQIDIIFTLNIVYH
jgi:hypothetical protein